MTSTGSPGRVRPNGVVWVTIWFFINAAIDLLGAVAISIFGLPAVIKETVGSDDRYIAIAAISFGLFLLVVSGVLNGAAVVGLLRLRVWARWLAIGLAALGLLFFPFGTIIGVLIIRYLLKDEAKQAFGAALPQPTPKESIKAAQSDQP